MTRDEIKQELEKIGQRTRKTTGHGESSSCLVFEDDYSNGTERLIDFCIKLQGTIPQQSSNP